MLLRAKDAAVVRARIISRKITTNTVTKKVPAEGDIGKKVLLFRSLVGVMFQFLGYN